MGGEGSPDVPHHVVVVPHQVPVLLAVQILATIIIINTIIIIIIILNLCVITFSESAMSSVFLTTAPSTICTTFLSWSSSEASLNNFIVAYDYSTLFTLLGNN